MITFYLTGYLFFVLITAVIISFLVLRLKLFSPQRVIGLIVLITLLPLVAGYFYVVYFDSLPEAVVPSITGLPLDQATQVLTEKGMRARVGGKVFEMEYPAGYVVSQRPEAGRTVKVGRTVNLMVSSGRRKVLVPNLLGRPLAQAEAVLVAAELRVGEIKGELNPTAPAGSILAQEPLPEEEVEIGRSVDLLIVAESEAKP